jgi:hypothetical protein
MVHYHGCLDDSICVRLTLDSGQVGQQVNGPVNRGAVAQVVQIESVQLWYENKEFAR